MKFAVPLAKYILPQLETRSTLSVLNNFVKKNLWMWC